ncbi:PREDICTED: uncharacterized protein LOC105368855 [Ceratosolen solmsi marchali]|uniref:Uncharacterized protein LOC105368855 n=1 Tax=Ceratosolen solmsi marchali TaxID=326594 RepID=A0AAJ6YXP6_9HYME|nr:PREDICTED: uncharacterized protein LOC105368855 [Ceratosolen solmsi marchali]
MIRKLLLLIVLSVLGYARTAPTTYDLRQDGDLNVKVDLENFVILVARPPSALDIFGSMSQLLAESRRAQAESAESAEAAVVVAATAAETATIPERADTKSAPDSAKSLEERAPEKSARSLEDVVASLRSLRDEAEAKNAGGKYKIVESVEEPQSLKLVGDALENCGPGRSRDRQGVCQDDGLAQE